MRTFAHRYSCFVAETKVTKKGWNLLGDFSLFLSQLPKVLADTNNKEYTSALELLDALMEMSKTKFIRHKTKYTKFRLVVPLWVMIWVMAVALLVYYNPILIN